MKTLTIGSIARRFLFLQGWEAMKASPRTFKLILRAMPSDVDVYSRLKRFLKMALRSYNFRCVRVEEITPKEGG